MTCNFYCGSYIFAKESMSIIYNSDNIIFFKLLTKRIYIVITNFLLLKMCHRYIEPIVKKGLNYVFTTMRFLC